MDLDLVLAPRILGPYLQKNAVSIDCVYAFADTGVKYVVLKLPIYRTPPKRCETRFTANGSFNAKQRFPIMTFDPGSFSFLISRGQGRSLGKSGYLLS